jgi:prepilin-type N-terminal cleavage/methylation domain-containing protein/prepilin-type processing-associated H-X9-DG protein
MKLTQNARSWPRRVPSGGGRAGQSGFTLIELLVVVAIIALLISILLPSLARARDQARSIKCLANMRSMSQAMQTFTMTHRGRFQLVTTSQLNAFVAKYLDPRWRTYEYEPPPNPAASTRTLLCWPLVLLREMYPGSLGSLRLNTDWGVLSPLSTVGSVSVPDKSQYEILLCPSDRFKISTPFYPEVGANSRYYGYLSYGINEDVVGWRGRNQFKGLPGFGPAGPGDLPCWKEGVKNAGERLQGKIDKVRDPADVVMFLDQGSVDGLKDGIEVVNLVTTRDCAGPYLEHVEYFYQTKSNGQQRLPTKRHRGGGLNMVFTDGHAGFAKRVKLKESVASDQPDYRYLPRVLVTPYTP